MSTTAYLYLKKETEKDPRFSEEKHNGVSYCSFGKLRIFKNGEDELFHYSLDLVYEAFPEILKDVVEKVSIRHTSTTFVHVRCGRYSYLSAKGVVDYINKAEMLIAIQGPIFEDAKDLYYKIRSKSIFPYEDWDGEQTLSPPKKKLKIVEYLSQKFHNIFKNVKGKLENK